MFHKYTDWALPTNSHGSYSLLGLKDQMIADMFWNVIVDGNDSGWFYLNLLRVC